MSKINSKNAKKISDSESSSDTSDSDTTVVKTKTTVKAAQGRTVKATAEKTVKATTEKTVKATQGRTAKPIPEKKSESGSDSETDVKNIISSADKASDYSSDSEQSDEELEMKAKRKDKKQKDTYKEIHTKMKELNCKRTDNNKQQFTLYEALTKLSKESKLVDKELDKLQEQLDKIYSEDVLKASKTKPKRKGNSGFKPQQLPNYLYNYLKDNEQITEDEHALIGNQVHKKLNNIFKDKGLRKGKLVYLDEKTCADLHVDEEFCNKLNLYEDDKVIIKFTVFPKFVSELIKRNTV
jgi:hypothetical protein